MMVEGATTVGDATVRHDGKTIEKMGGAVVTCREMENAPCA